MSQQKREKLTVTVTTTKPRSQKPFVPIEKKLTPAQLEEIAGGVIQFN